MSKGQLQSWLDQDWVRLGADGSIKGSCGGRKEAEGKPKCIPRSKANRLSKSQRAKLVLEKEKKIQTQIEKVNLLWFLIN